ncbi:MAG: PAS domain S-box protein [Desulfosalsimonas sp.]|uniref:PAS domain-containing protein n=1 Tax=Desulfosalsimonas sp. TaxID=3073848 RepID=UPI00397104E4
MSDEEKTKNQLLEILGELRCQNHRLSKRILELEAVAEKQKRAGETLRQSESMMRAISESAQDAIVMMDVEGRISYWNPAAGRTFGYTNNEALGRKLHHLLAPQRYQDLHQNAFPEFQRSGRGGAIGKTLQLNALRKTGEEFPIELSLSSLHLGDGWHAIGIIRDITDRIQAQKALEESEEKFRQVVDNMNEVFWLRSADNRELLYISPSYEHIWGKTCQSLPDLDEARYAARIAAKIVNSFRKPFEIDNHPLFVTTSLGIAVYPGDGTSQAHLLKNADIAMYQAKQTGRDKYQLCKAG